MTERLSASSLRVLCAGCRGAQTCGSEGTASAEPVRTLQPAPYAWNTTALCGTYNACSRQSWLWLTRFSSPHLHSYRAHGVHYALEQALGASTPQESSQRSPCAGRGQAVGLLMHSGDVQGLACDYACHTRDASRHEID